MWEKLLSVLLFSIAVINTLALASCGNDDIYTVENGRRNAALEEQATQIMRNATVVSSFDYSYAFGMSKMVILDNKAYINYAANKYLVDGDKINNNNESCCSVVNIENMSITALFPKTLSKLFYDGTAPSGKSYISSGTKTITKDGKIASFALMRFNNNNPYYCYSFVNPDEQLYNYVTCRLKYVDSNHKEHNVDYTINNYRKMLVDMGYSNTYIASTNDAYDNINLQYEQETDLYYALVATNTSATNLPFVLMKSEDMATWTPVASMGNSFGAGEISMILKEGVAYVAYRTFSNGMRWLVFDLTNNTIISVGHFEECRNVLSKPDTFTFGKDVFMAVNVYPSVYGTNYTLDPYSIRQEINIYKIVKGKPEFFRKVYNPDGINYFSFCESSNGRIYLGFSEDRRHLYKRMFSNMSFVDVTELFDK